MARPTDDGFTDFVRDHGPGLLRTACLLTGDRARGEDLAQTALARAFAHWPKVQRADSPLAYVRRMLVNSHLSWLRLLPNTEQVIAAVPDRGDGTDLQAVHAQADELRTALLRLSPRVRTAVVLRYFDDLSEAETARLMRCSTSTVNNHVSRGLATLRTLLNGRGAHEELSRRSS
ncbi:SigE family RNA polymerase sigma factor [Blastococcus sp. SYSU DS0619]